MITKKAHFAIGIVTLSLVGVWPSPSPVPSGTNWFRPAATRPDDALDGRVDVKRGLE
jgi:hypothetical protein